MPAGTIADIQALIDALPKDGAYLRVPPGEYTGEGSLSFSGFTAGNAGGKTIIDMEGVWLSGGLSGTFYIHVNSCKRLTLHGLRAQNHDLLIKGCWWSDFNVEVRRITFGGPGVSFSSAYWNNFWGGMAQQLLFHENMIAPANALFFHGTSLRSNAGQGYAAGHGYSIGFRANQNVKGLRFYGGDISYGSSSDWVIGSLNTTGSIDMVAHGIYLDSGRLNQVLDQAGPPRRRIKWVDCYNWMEP